MGMMSWKLSKYQRAMITKNKDRLMEYDINDDEILSIESFVDEIVSEGICDEDEAIDSYREFLRDTREDG